MIKLQPLRISTGWNISYNKFLEVEPNDLKEDNDIWMHFTQDILQIKYTFKKINLMIDLGWYPETEFNGTFRLEVIKDKEWDNPLETFESRSKKEIVEKIEKIIDKISNNHEIYIAEKVKIQKK